MTGYLLSDEEIKSHIQTHLNDKENTISIKILEDCVIFDITTRQEFKAFDDRNDAYEELDMSIEWYIRHI